MSVVGGEYMSPFVRTRAPELEQQYGLSSSELLAFIDGLNEAFMANPALQVTDAIGTIVGFVPLQTTQIVGASLNVAAGIGTAGVSIVRTKRYMKKANETIFKPKGLHAQICKTEQMLTQIGKEGDTVVFAKSQFQAMLGSAQAQEPSGNAIARRMESLGDRVMKLSFDNIAAPVSPNNWAKKLGSYAAQHAEKKQLKELQKKQTKAQEKAAKAEQKLSKAADKHGSNDGEVEKIMRDMESVQNQIQYLDPTDRRYEKDLRGLQREYRELERNLRQLDAQRSRKTERMEKSTRKRDAKNAKRDVKEAKKIRKIYWILITTEEESPQGDDDWASDDSPEESISSDRKR
jgi:chromosome segregation ATPase